MIGSADLGAKKEKYAADFERPQKKTKSEQNTADVALTYRRRWTVASKRKTHRRNIMRIFGQR